MATFSIGFTSSQVFVMLSVATYIMLAAAAPLVHIRTDRSACENGGEILEGITDIVSYTLLLVNIAKLCTISACNALLVHTENVLGEILELYKAFLTVSIIITTY